MGHEFIGVVEDIGADVRTVRRGDLVVAPFAYSDGSCEFCRDGLQTSCVHGGFWARDGVDGGQGEAVRVPLADGTLVKLPVGADDAAHPLAAHPLRRATAPATTPPSDGGVAAGSTVTVDRRRRRRPARRSRRQAARRRADHPHGPAPARTDLGREFGATDVVAERGDEGIAKVRELTGGGGPVVIEAVGHRPAYDQAYGVVRPGGTISRVGAPQYEEAPVGFGSLFAHNITLTGGPAPARAYIDELLPDILEGRIEPGRVFDRAVGLDGIARRVPGHGRTRGPEGAGTAVTGHRRLRAPMAPVVVSAPVPPAPAAHDERTA